MFQREYQMFSYPVRSYLEYKLLHDNHYLGRN
jgi:hypothetical protein